MVLLNGHDHNQNIYVSEFEHNLISINDRVPLENVAVAYETVSMHHHLEKQLISNKRKYDFCQKFLGKKNTLITYKQ